jgi:hypothetical protein
VIEFDCRRILTLEHRGELGSCPVERVAARPAGVTNLLIGVVGDLLPKVLLAVFLGERCERDLGQWLTPGCFLLCSWFEPGS